MRTLSIGLSRGFTFIFAAGLDGAHIGCIIIVVVIVSLVASFRPSSSHRFTTSTRFLAIYLI
jgi:hypothetical protein